MSSNLRIVETFSYEDTYRLGQQLATQAVPGQVICLTGDLGTGKTVFTQGFARGLGVTDYVDSPTFTIVKEYHDGRMPFYHFDVYRIGDVSEMDEIGYEEYFYGDGVCIVECSSGGLLSYSDWKSYFVPTTSHSDCEIYFIG